jgi:hypothetical protein
MRITTAVGIHLKHRLEKSEKETPTLAESEGK